MRTYAGWVLHLVSDHLHLLAHWLVDDPRWRIRNG